MFNRILVGIDGSKNSWVAADYGIWLSKVLKRPVVGIHIVDIRLIEGAFLEDIAGALGFTEFENLSQKVKEALDQKGKVLLDIFAKECRQKGADCSIVQAFGIVGKELVNMADPEDLLIIGRHGRHKNLLEMILGTTADYVVRHAPCPVMLVSEKFKEIEKLAVYSKKEEVFNFAVKFAKALGLKEIYKFTEVKEDTEEKEEITVKPIFIPAECEDGIDVYIDTSDIDALVTERKNADMNIQKPALLP